MIDLRRLLVLQELSRQGTVAAAASALHLTPSAVSQQLAALSREVGCDVTVRDGRNLRITSAGHVLLSHAEELAARLEALSSDLQRHHTGEVGTVVVGAFQTAAKQIVAPAAAALAETHPRLEVNLRQVDAPVSLHELAAGRLDIALSVEYAGGVPATADRLARLHLLRDEFRAVVPAWHRLARRRSIRLEELRDDPWIGNIPGSPCHFVTMAACAACGFTPRVRHQVDDWAITVDLVAAGLGVSLLPNLARPGPREDVAVVALTGRPAARNVVAFTRRGTQEAPTVARVLVAMQEAAGRRQGPAPVP